MFQSILDMLKKMFMSGTKMPSYNITTLSPGRYDVAVILPAVGTQHYKLDFDANTNSFNLSGKVAIIGDDAGMPASFFSQVINDAFSKWVNDNVVKMKLSEQLSKMKVQHKINSK